MTLQYLAQHYCDASPDCSSCKFDCHSGDICPILCIKEKKPLPENLTREEMGAALDTLWQYAENLKTYLEDFKERYPNAPLGDDGTPLVCPCDLYGAAADFENCATTDSDCKACWNRTM